MLWRRNMVLVIGWACSMVCLVTRVDQVQLLFCGHQQRRNKAPFWCGEKKRFWQEPWPERIHPLYHSCYEMSKRPIWFGRISRSLAKNFGWTLYVADSHSDGATLVITGKLIHWHNPWSLCISNPCFSRSCVLRGKLYVLKETRKCKIHGKGFLQLGNNWLLLKLRRCYTVCPRRIAQKMPAKKSSLSCVIISSSIVYHSKNATNVGQMQMRILRNGRCTFKEFGCCGRIRGRTLYRLSAQATTTLRASRKW